MPNNKKATTFSLTGLQVVAFLLKTSPIISNLYSPTRPAALFFLGT